MCPEEQLSAYMDKELNDEERLEIESHLNECLSCRLLLNDLIKLKQTFSTEMVSLAEPAGFESSIMQAITHENKIRNLAKLWFLVPLFAAMAIILLTIVAGPVAVHFINGTLVITRALLFTLSHAVSDMPILVVVSVILSLCVLVASFISLRKLLKSAAV